MTGCPWCVDPEGWSDAAYEADADDLCPGHRAQLHPDEEDTP